MRENEDSTVSSPCEVKNDFEYDNCLYEQRNKLLIDKFNCTFGLLVNSNQSALNECTVLDVTENRETGVLFRDIISGKWKISGS